MLGKKTHHLTSKLGGLVLMGKNLETHHTKTI